MPSGKQCRKVSARPGVRASRARRRRLLRWAAAGVMILALLNAGVATLLSGPFTLQSRGPRALLVDQLSETFANPAFIANATSVLEQAGFTVDYYSGQQVSIDLYRQVFPLGYDIIILRAHVARFKESDGSLSDEVTLFTNEPFLEQGHVAERLSGLVAQSRYMGDETQMNLFSVTDRFILSLKGEFGGATVVIMGCSGLRSEAMAQAFVRKGARAVAGWDGEISAAYADSATESFLRRLITAGTPIAQAAQETMSELGPDPVYGGRLVSFPGGGL